MAIASEKINNGIRTIFPDIKTCFCLIISHKVNQLMISLLYKAQPLTYSL